MIKRYFSQIVEVDGIDVQTTVIGKQWPVDYIVFPKEDTHKYRDILLKERVKLIRVLPGLIVFE